MPLFLPQFSRFCESLANSCPENVEIVSTFYRLSYFGGKRAAKNMIKIANECLLFELTTKHSSNLRVDNVKRIANAKKAMTRGNLLACTQLKNKYIQQLKKFQGCSGR